MPVSTKPWNLGTIATCASSRCRKHGFITGRLANWQIMIPQFGLSAAGAPECTPAALLSGGRF
jgi:hypothetical protein